MPGIFLISATIFNTTCGGEETEYQKTVCDTDLMKIILEKLEGKLLTPILPGTREKSLLLSAQHHQARNTIS